MQEYNLDLEAVRLKEENLRKKEKRERKSALSHIKENSVIT